MTLLAKPPASATTNIGERPRKMCGATFNYFGARDRPPEPIGESDDGNESEPEGAAPSLPSQQLSSGQGATRGQSGGRAFDADGREKPYIPIEPEQASSVSNDDTLYPLVQGRTQFIQLYLFLPFPPSLFISLSFFVSLCRSPSRRSTRKMQYLLIPWGLSIMLRAARRARRASLPSLRACKTSPSPSTDTAIRPSQDKNVFCVPILCVNCSYPKIQYDDKRREAAHSIPEILRSSPRIPMNAAVRMR